MGVASCSRFQTGKVGNYTTLRACSFLSQGESENIRDRVLEEVKNLKVAIIIDCSYLNKNCTAG